MTKGGGPRILWPFVNTASRQRENSLVKCHEGLPCCGVAWGGGAKGAPVLDGTLLGAPNHIKTGGRQDSCLSHCLFFRSSVYTGRKNSILLTENEGPRYWTITRRMTWNSQTAECCRRYCLYQIFPTERIPREGVAPPPPHQMLRRQITSNLSAIFMFGFRHLYPLLVLHVGRTDLAKNRQGRINADLSIKLFT
jgi:hypothetical protein